MASGLPTIDKRRGSKQIHDLQISIGKKPDLMAIGRPEGERGVISSSDELGRKGIQGAKPEVLFALAVQRSVNDLGPIR